MNTYRITKYNPKYRNKEGAYIKDEWTEFADIGKKFSGKPLTKLEYTKVENAYVKVLLSFLKESSISQMIVNKIQNFKNVKYKNKVIKRGQIYSLTELENLFRLILKGQFWCKFENNDGCYVDFGWDYYSYVGVTKQCKKSIVLANNLKLYVEEFSEPILD